MNRVDVSTLLGLDLPTPYTDKLARLWNQMQDTDGQAQMIMVDLVALSHLRQEDTRMANFDWNGNGNTWRGIPIEAHLVRIPLPKYVGPGTPIMDIENDDTKLITIRYEDRTTGRTGYLDAPDNSEHVML